MHTDPDSGTDGVREAVEVDLPAILDMGERFHRSSHYSALPFDREMMADTCRRLIASPDGMLLIAGDFAMLGAVLFRLYMSPVTACQELFWWSERPGVGMKLLDVAEKQARDKGAGLILMMSLDDRLRRVYARRGYAPAEHTFVRTL